MPDDRFVIVNDRDMPDVCLQHLLALTLVDGDLTFASSHDHARMKDPAVLDVRRRIEAIPSAELAAARPARQAIVEIACADGRRLSHRPSTVLGTTDHPMTEAQEDAEHRQSGLEGKRGSVRVGLRGLRNIQNKKNKTTN